MSSPHPKDVGALRMASAPSGVENASGPMFWLLRLRFSSEMIRFLMGNSDAMSKCSAEQRHEISCTLDE